MALLLTAVPFVYYRWNYADHKRLREVAPGRVYRSGHLTAAGFAEAVARFHLRTIINLQDEYPDPDVDASYFDRRTEKERTLCARLGVRYIYLPPDLVPLDRAPLVRPRAIDQFLAVMDDPASYPVLLHCRAGLHRTGSMVAIFRMEYQGWGVDAAIREMKANGFGEWPCTSANEYVAQYVLSYRPRDQGSGARGQGPPVSNANAGLSPSLVHDSRPLTPEP
jgi:protein tyrosine/serine phosphatase